VFNYLMGGDGWKKGGDSISYGRFYGRQAYEFVQGQAPSELLALPTLFMPEVASGGEGQIAHIGTLTSARIAGAEVKLQYYFDSAIPPVPVPRIIELADELGIPTEGFMLAHTHWRVLNADLYLTFLRHGVGQPLKPSVFDLDPTYDNELISVMMPFDAAFKPVYEAITEGVQDAGLRCRRADDLWLHSKVVQTIVSLICQSGIVIADCTKRNANVFYEAGIAHTIGKEVILIAQSMEDVPFDLQHLSVITYMSNRQGLEELSAKLAKRIKDIRNPHRRA